MFNMKSESNWKRAAKAAAHTADFYGNMSFEYLFILAFTGLHWNHPTRAISYTA